MDAAVFLFVGVALLFAGLVALLKIGLWVWLATHVTRAGRQQLQQQPQTPPAGGGGFKTALATVSTLLGLLATTVGLLKDCNDLGNGQQEAPPMYQDIQPQPMQQPAYSNICCTSQGNCPMVDGAQPVGGSCFCFNAFGAMINGQVCN